MVSRIILKLGNALNSTYYTDNGPI